MTSSACSLVDDDVVVRLVLQPATPITVKNKARANNITDFFIDGAA